jgi:hypothetical protein
MKWFSLFASLFLAAGLAFADDAPATFPVSSFTFARPADWAWVPVTSTMRKAQLKVGGENGADVVFYFFGANSGDVKSNTDRWLKQFDSAAGAEKVEPVAAGATKVTIVSTEGTYHSGMPGGPTTPMANYALLGAILESGEGNVFVKMTGPAELVKSKHQQFVDFVTAAAKTAK